VGVWRWLTGFAALQYGRRSRFWDSSILFLEISEDRPSPTVVKYILRSLAATGSLKQARGVLFGRPQGDEAGSDEYDNVVLQVLAEEGLQTLPLITRMDFGHTDPKFILPLGIEAELDCDRHEFRLVEAPTS
jgi:muramoyltetrapeptide carboxypeptidase LdcA involved in peptidoglycan recycling